MKRIAEPLAQNTKAFGLFIDELSAHARRAAEVLVNPDSAAGGWAELKDGFHRGKGGAGFFALAEVARLAAALEELCTAPGSADLNAEQARGLLERLSLELSELQKARRPGEPGGSD